MSPAPTTPLVIYGHKRPLILSFAPSLMMGVGQYAVGFGGIGCLEAVGVKVTGRPKIWRKGLPQPVPTRINVSLALTNPFTRFTD